MENPLINSDQNKVETIEIEANVGEEKALGELKPTEKESKNIEALTVPYILNGELYKILARNGENVTVRCCSCPSGQRGIYRGSVRSTGNFHMHIKRRHPYLLGRLHDMKVNSLLERRDRLMKNRKAKLQRIFVSNGELSVEHEQHKLKIKRAFQRHQAEAKGNEKQEIVSLESHRAQAQYHGILQKRNSECNQNFSEQKSENLLESQQLPVSSCSLVTASSDKAYCELRIVNVSHLTPSMNISAMPTQQSTPVPLHFPSNYERSEFGSPPTCSQFKGESYHAEHPLDLSVGTRSSSPIASNSFGSSGIGLEPMWSNTTVANTISTAISFDELGSQNSGQSEFGDASWWKQHLTYVLRDIRNDIRARNRIEHNRLLLEVAKLKFLHPEFYFDLKE